MSEPAEWWTESVKTCSGRAKKPFKCAECGGIIQPRQKYHSFAGKWEGDFAEYKHHPLCWALYEEMCDWLRANTPLHEDEMPGIGELVETTLMEEHESGGAVPAWWPAGMEISKAALRAAADASPESAK